MEGVAAWGALAFTVSIAVTRPRLSPRLQLEPVHGAVVSVLVLLLIGAVPVGELAGLAVQVWRSFLAIVGIMVMTAAAMRVGAVSAVASRLFEGSSRSPAALLARVFLLGALVSTVLGNDAMILLMTPLTVVAVRRRWPDRPDLPPIFALAVFLTIGVAPLVVSNPMNMIVADYAGIGFNAYALRMAPLALVCWLVAWAAVRLVYGRALTGPEKEGTRVVPADLSTVQRQVTLVLGTVLAAYPVVAWFDDHAVWIVAVVGAATAVAIALRGTEASLGELVVHGVAWKELIFLFSALALAIGLERAGAADLLAGVYAGAGLGVIGGVSAVGSALVNNHPMAILNLLALERIEGAGVDQVLAMLVGGDVGPRLLPIGSLAGLLWLDACRRLDVEVSLGRFVGMGLLTTVPTVALCLWILTWS